jgi:hypothetical protein
LVERRVRNAKAVGSTPIGSTISLDLFASYFVRFHLSSRSVLVYALVASAHLPRLRRKSLREIAEEGPAILLLSGVFPHGIGDRIDNFVQIRTRHFAAGNARYDFSMLPNIEIIWADQWRFDGDLNLVS